MRSVFPLTAGWQLARSAPGACMHPDELGGAPLDWRDAPVPGTVAQALDSPLDAPADHDAHDWWYRTTFANPGTHPGDAPRGRTPSRYYLCFEGLATLVEVWLNGQSILVSRNMFVGHRVDVTDLLRDVNQLALRFAALEPLLAAKKPRPRWKTALVTRQNLRWVRTTLLGRMPGWNPAIPVVGPWAPITLERFERIDVTSLDLQALTQGTDGHIRLRAAVDVLEGSLQDARLRVGDEMYALEGRDGVIGGDITIADAPLWWPHTHGTPRRLRCHLELRVDGEWLSHDCGMVGFKSVASPFLVNGVPVFCRGAVWTTMDIRTLRAKPGELRRALEMARDAGVNMLRVGGTMHYECDEFYELCDELGILVWQDFMFANMDYPVNDPEFRADIEAEARHVLRRLQRHPCIATYCGGSEIAQQAAMMGLAQEHWSNHFFLETLPRLCEAAHPGIPYHPSTPWGGALPFHVSSGIAHYYGVGAYRRPLADVKAARVKFAAESLAFANVPEPASMARVVEGHAAAPPHDPRWKAGVPRDNGAGWDFEDVRDHYLRELFGEDAVALRSHDLERYYALSRLVSGEVMAHTFAQWRAPHSGCAGALVWNWRDVRPGAGWGIVDDRGDPKAAFWYLKRAWARRAVFFTDEGLDGLAVHIANDTPQPLDARIEIAMFRDGRINTGVAQAMLKIPARAAVSRHVDGLFGYFTDAANAYRFGPPRQDVVCARLMNAASGETIAESFHFPAGWNLPLQHGASVRCQAHWREDGKVAVTLESDAFLQAVSVSCDGFVPDDNYFHVAPGRAKRIVFTPRIDVTTFRASFEALNLREAIVVAATREAALAGSERPPSERGLDAA